MLQTTETNHKRLVRMTEIKLLTLPVKILVDKTFGYHMSSAGHNWQLVFLKNIYLYREWNTDKAQLTSMLMWNQDPQISVPMLDHLEIKNDKPKGYSTQLIQKIISYRTGRRMNRAHTRQVSHLFYLPLYINFLPV